MEHAHKYRPYASRPISNISRTFQMSDLGGPLGTGFLNTLVTMLLSPMRCLCTNSEGASDCEFNHKNQ